MRLNGSEVRLNSPVNLAEFLSSRGFRMDRVAVEMNGRIVPKANIPETYVDDGDVLEVVGMVGGG